jgi:carboxylate-amine ligase
MHFKPSEPLTFGVELELQIVDPETGRLSPSAQALWQALPTEDGPTHYALEATLSTLEINSSIHHRADRMADEVAHLVSQVQGAAMRMSRQVRGGGAQISQFWNERVMAPSERAQALAQRFGFLPKRFSTYGMHVHVGMPDAESAIRVANVLQGLVPLFIAMSAASPFLQLSDTGFAAARPLEPLVYPHGGPMPHLRDWGHLETVTGEFFKTGIAESLKDIYWDVRPKPEFGTVEVRVFDTPLSAHKAVALATFTRGVAALALANELTLAADSLAYFTDQRVSRFLACRDGMDARLFNPCSAQWVPAREWMDELLTQVQQHNPWPFDAAHLAQVRTWTVGEQDHQTMRRLWSALSAAHDEVEALRRYSSFMADLLLDAKAARAG